MNTRKSSSRLAGTSRSQSRSRLINRSRDRTRARLTPPSRGGHRASPPVDPEKQRLRQQYEAAVKNYEAAVRAFHRQNYEKAALIFEKLASSGVRDVAERAQVHLRLCRHRSRHRVTHPKSAEELYTLGVASLNGRMLEAAAEQLRRADKLKPNQDHIRYALAATHALRGDIAAAIEHLEAAVALRPENRFHARRDEDFQGLASDPRFRRLLSSVSS